MRSALYTGTVTHARDDVYARRTFRYPVYMADLDLAELPALDRALRLFSHERRNVFSLHERDYEAGSLDLAGLRAANGLPAPATTRLVTNLRVLGYVFNPVSFFLDYDARGALTSVIAEVNNTYGGRRRYVLGPAQRIESSSRVGFRCARELFVSPFLHGHAGYEWWFDAPLDGDRLAITMYVDTAAGGDIQSSSSDTEGQTAGATGAVARTIGEIKPSGPIRGAAGDRVFVARFDGTRRPLTDRALAAVALRYPLMTLQVIGLIHFEALKLRLLGAPYRRPGADHRPITSPASIASTARSR